MNNQPISVLIVTRNRRDFLERCLMCLYATSTSNERKIYVWDNASEDDTHDYLATLKKWNDIVIIRSENNIGTRARQEMVKMINSPLVLTIDDDAWITTPGWATAITQCFDNDPQLGALMFGRTADERNNFGVTWDGKDYNTFERPRFKSENIVGVFNGTIEPPDERHRSVMKKIGDHWILPENDKIGLEFGGWCAIWRTEIIRDHNWEGASGVMTDMASEWVDLVRNNFYYKALTIEFLAYHACGAWWHLMCHGELSWQDKVRESPVIYGRESSEQQKWYEQAKEWSGWGSGIDIVK
jgi:glycosyltransferase involved in cell wall biosynthesis